MSQRDGVSVVSQCISLLVSHCGVESVSLRLCCQVGLQQHLLRGRWLHGEERQPFDVHAIIGYGKLLMFPLFVIS